MKMVLSLKKKKTKKNSNKPTYGLNAYKHWSFYCTALSNCEILGDDDVPFGGGHYFDEHAEKKKNEKLLDA